MAVQTLNKADTENLVTRFENLPDRFKFQMIGYLERLEEEISLKETKDINGFSPYDAARIDRAIKQLEAGGGTFHELIED